MNNTQPSASVQIHMLGGFRLQAGDRAVTDEINRSQKLWSVLCYLIVHRDRVIPQTELIEQFWTNEERANPVSALKTLFYRIRGMIDPLFPEHTPPVRTHRGGYCWNPDLSCELDVDLFERCCAEAELPHWTEEERMALYRQAVELYQGDFLPKFGDQLWIVPLSAHYHSLYLKVVKQYAALLEAAGEAEAMYELCLHASQLDPLDESLYILAIRALLMQGKHAAALNHYEQASDVLYRNLGVRPSNELRILYKAIMDAEQSLETDLSVIQQELREHIPLPGAFVCEYGFFKEMYQLEVRRAARSGVCLHLALITVSMPDGSSPPARTLNLSMDALREVLVDSLRRGDLISRYSQAQYILMLPSAAYEDATMVMERIVTSFHRKHRHSAVRLSFKLRELELS